MNTNTALVDKTKFFGCHQLAYCGHSATNEIVIAVNIAIPDFNLENGIDVSTTQTDKIDSEGSPCRVLVVHDGLRTVDHGPVA